VNSLFALWGREGKVIRSRNENFVDGFNDAIDSLSNTSLTEK
jgi:hypothetical protein